MRPILTCALLALLGLVAAGPVWASDAVILSDGTIRKAKVLEVLEDGIRVRFSPKSGGTAEIKLAADRLDPHYFYELRNEVAGEDAKAHLKLALWSLEAGLFSRAKIQVERATQLDPQLVKDIQEGHLPEIREGIARRILESAQDDIDHDRFELGERKLEILLARMPDTEAGTEAADVYAELGDLIRGREAREQEEALERMADEERAAAEERDRLLKPIDRDLKRGKELLTSGLTEDSESKALSLIKDAIGRGKRALGAMDRLEKAHADDEQLVAEIQARREKTIKGMVKAHLARADIYIWRGSTSNARKEIEEARKLDPDNPDVAAAEARADSRDDQDALELRWTRSRREGMRFRAGRGGGGARRR